MTAVTEGIARRSSIRLGDGLVLLALALGATAVTLAMNAGLVAETLRGRFGDTDDAMRLVEVRNWLAGQSWFDMTIARVDPPLGTFMHWSRLVDMPMAAMIRLFELFVDKAQAEHLAAVAVPTCWLVALYAGVARLATLLVGRGGRLPALLGMVFSGATLVQFAPGRIGHHAPETVALVVAIGCAVAALDRRRAWEAGLAGALAALSLSMSLETLPFQAVLAGTLVSLWVWRGAALAPMLAWFGAGLIVALPLTFLATVGPSRWLAPVCDAYSAAHLGAGMIGAAGAMVLARLTCRLRTSVARLAAAAVPAILVVGYVGLATPACLHSPFAGVDPLVKTLWLDHVVESQPLPAFLRARPMIGLAVVGPLLLGALGCLVAAVCEAGTARLRFLLVGALSASGIALGFWQVRVLGSVTPLALCGGVYLVTRLARTFAAWQLTLAAAVAPFAILAFGSTVWLLALPEDRNASLSVKAACLAPDALAPLAALAPGSVVAPLDSGSHLLEATRLSVFAAPYHRNDDGNRFAFEVFAAPPAEAGAMLAARHVAYVMTCPGMGEMDRVAAQAPDGLAARLRAGAVPAFLTPLRLEGSRYEVFAVSRTGK